MLLNRTVYATVAARIYHTVAICTAAKLKRFHSTLALACHLNPIIHNLWINHEVDLSRKKRYAITSNLLDILKFTPNLKRLAIMTPLYYQNIHVAPIALLNLIHLVIPSVWLTARPDSGTTSMLSQFPADLTALYIRGRVGSEEANRLVAHCMRLRYVTVKVFASVSLSDLVKFTQILVSELKELLSLELVVISGQADCLSSGLQEAGLAGPGSVVEEKVSVHGVVDDDNEMDIWMNESQSTRPTLGSMIVYRCGIHGHHYILVVLLHAVYR